MTPHELAGVLRAVLARHPELAVEAEQIAFDTIAAPSVEDVAYEVLYAVTSLDDESLHGRAGKQAWGYVEPSEAAWEMLSEAIEDLRADMKRLADLGLHEAAALICCGIVLGLHRAAKDASSDGPLGWAPDFPAEEACQVVDELIQSCAPKDRNAMRERLVKTLRELVPSWSDMIAGVARGASTGR